MSLQLYGVDPAFSGEVSVPSPPEEGDVSLHEHDLAGSPQFRSGWPPLLHLSKEVEVRLTTWLRHELSKARSERQRMVEDWKKWQTQYWAKPDKPVKNFPFQRAANLVVPLTAIAVEAAHARLVNLLFSTEPFWTIRPTNKEWSNAARPMEDWLQRETENPNSLNLLQFCNHSLLELLKLGTCVGKSGYEKVTKKSLVDDGELGLERFVTVRQGATLDYVPLANWLCRIHETDPQLAAWVGEEHEFTWAQLKRMASDGRLYSEGVEHIRRLPGPETDSGSARDYQEHVDKLAKTQDQWQEEYSITEIWCSFDVDEDGWDEEIVIDYHEPTNTILSARYNWYEDLRRPYRVCQYIVVEGRVYGIGIGKQSEQFQEEVTTIHRQRLDNATLANMRMIAIKKSSGYGPGEPVFPGKMWFLDDPSDIQPVQMSEIYQSSVYNEEAATRLNDKRNGVNEILLGMPQTGTPGTATGDLARIAEGNQKFDLVLKNVRRWLSLLGQDVIANFQEFGAQERYWNVLGEKGEWVERVLMMPSSHVTDGAIVSVTVTDSVVNRQVMQQQWLGLFQLITNHYGQALQYGQLLAELTEDPELILTIARRALLGSDEAMKRLLETFNIVDTDIYLLSADEEDQNAPTGPGSALPGGIGGPEIPPEAAGMEGGTAPTQGTSGGFDLGPDVFNL